MFIFSVVVFKVDKWIRKERAKYNRLATTKSGQQRVELKPSEQATLDRWSFYKDHLLEGKNRTSANVSKIIFNGIHLSYFVFIFLLI